MRRTPRKTLLGLTSATLFAVGFTSERDSDSPLTHSNLSPLTIIRPGETDRYQASPANFTGNAYVEGVFAAEAPSRLTLASVTFEPGARTDWHTHPLGQTLIATDGKGLVQAEGGPIEEIGPGDVAHIPANIRHWHGASPASKMIHIAILEPLDGERVRWMEPVSDADYPNTNPKSTTARGESRAQQLLGDIAPALADLTDEVLYGQVWERPGLSKRDRSLSTISALIAMNRPDQLRSHIALGRRNGLSDEELSETITHLAFYSGWPNSVTAVGIAREVFRADQTDENVSSDDSTPPTINVKDLHLVYQGAISENIEGQVNIRPVRYEIDGITIAANVYTPANYTPSSSFPAVVVAHPNGGVKEQVAGLYAQRLAEQGFITIVADAAYQGASGGLPRNVDTPTNRIEDIHSMADYISQIPGVDTTRLGLLGICGGGGYSLKAAQTDKRFKSVATLSMFNTGLVRRNGFRDTQLDTIPQRLRQASDARAQEAAGGEVRYAADTNPSADEIARLPFDLYREGYEYYGNTHAHPNSTFRYTMSSLLELMRFDAASNMDLIDQPLMMIAGSRADTLYMTEQAFPLATNASRKELVLIDGASHIETYWMPDYVNQAVEKLSGFFTETLSTGPSQ